MTNKEIATQDAPTDFHDERLERELHDKAVEELEVCEHCLGTGVIVEDGDDGEGHATRGTESRKCICQLKDDEDDMDDDS